MITPLHNAPRRGVLRSSGIIREPEPERPGPHRNPYTRS
jgi:hypothetical protein